MNRSNAPVTVSTLKKWWDTGTLKCTLPFQRRSGMWGSITKGNFIWSVLSDTYVFPIILLKDKVESGEGEKNAYKYEILDGQQRLTTLFDFMDGRLQLHSATPQVEIDGKVNLLAGCFFSDLSEECQEVIRGYRFSIQCLEDYTIEEVERLFFNMNSGVALSAIQKAKPKMGTDLSSFYDRLLQGPFFTQAINITEAQARREDDLLMLLQVALRLDNMEGRYEYKNISAASCLAYAAGLRESATKEQNEVLSDLVAYLDDCFRVQNKFLKKNNVCIVGVCARIAMQEGVEPGAFRAFVNDFASGVHYEYDGASGSGNIKAPKVQMRLRAMFFEMCKYFRWEPSVVRRPFSEEVNLYEGVYASLAPQLQEIGEDEPEEAEEG